MIFARHHLPADSQSLLMSEISRVSRTLEALPGITKINVAALGNRVPQLHVHVLGRHPEDATWPDPVWGAGSAEPYAAGAADALIERLRSDSRVHP